MPYFIVEVKESKINQYRVRARTASAARREFDNDPEEAKCVDEGELEYEIISVEKDDDQEEGD